MEDGSGHAYTEMHFYKGIDQEDVLKQFKESKSWNSYIQLEERSKRHFGHSVEEVGDLSRLVAESRYRYLFDHRTGEVDEISRLVADSEKSWKNSQGR